MVCAVCSAARLSTPAPPEPLPHLYASANQLPSTDRLRSAGEETLASLLSHDGNHEAGSAKRLIVNARRADGSVELEYVTTSEGYNLEDRLVYLSEQPEIQHEQDISFRLLRHYASSVRHRKYHDIDIVTVRVDEIGR